MKQIQTVFQNKILFLEIFLNESYRKTYIFNYFNSSPIISLLVLNSCESNGNDSSRTAVLYEIQVSIHDFLRFRVYVACTGDQA